MHHKHHASLGRYISMIYRHRDRYFERELKPYDIRPGQLRILLRLHKALHRDKDITQAGDIADGFHPGKPGCEVAVDIRVDGVKQCDIGLCFSEDSE